MTTPRRCLRLALILPVLLILPLALALSEHHPTPRLEVVALAPRAPSPAVAAELAPVPHPADLAAQEASNARDGALMAQWQAASDVAREKAARAAQPVRNHEDTAPPLGGSTGGGSVGSGRCGGDLPPCYVMMAESGGDPTAVNSSGCGGRGCYGKWQFDPQTSAGLGYDRPMNEYPESVQDEAARRLLAESGCGQWSTC